MSNENKGYTVCFPVHKQGDDMAWEIQTNRGDTRAALKAMFNRYTDAANVAKCLLQRYQDGWEIDGDCHNVSLRARPSSIIDELIDNGVIEPQPDDVDLDNWTE